MRESVLNCWVRLVRLVLVTLTMKLVWAEALLPAASVMLALNEWVPTPKL